MKKLIALTLVLLLCLSTAYAAEWREGLGPNKPTTHSREIDFKETLGYFTMWPIPRLPAEVYCDVLEMFLPRNADDRIRAAANTLGWGKFMSLAFIIVNIYCVVFFTIETFTFADFSGWLTAVVCSTLLTLMVIVAFESVRK